MSTHLYVAPAATGKTAYVLSQTLEAARELRSTPRVCLPTHLQIRSWRRRLARQGGALGVRLLTFDRLYADCLNAAGEIYTELSDPVQYRLIRTIVDTLPLRHFNSIRARPGFIRVIQELVAELKAARIRPELFVSAVQVLGDEPRLRDIAEIYKAYQDHLRQKRWADRAGLGWLAVESLERRAPNVGAGWPLLIFDGFDDFTPVQFDMLALLTTRAESVIVTLTGTTDDAEGRAVFRRFDKTRSQLEQALQTTAEPLPASFSQHDAGLVHLADSLFRDENTVRTETTVVELIEAPDREKEVRAALRWLKKQFVASEVAPGDLALLARSIAPYRSFILQTADEFGLPIELLDGLPLKTNPAVAAIIDLLSLLVPWASDARQPALPYRLVIETLRSPYFDWVESTVAGTDEPIAIIPEDVEMLSAVARWGQVIGGRLQWEQALDGLVGISSSDEQTDDERDRPVGLPTGSQAYDLREKFRRFTDRITPEEENRRYRDWVRWLEELIGPDPAVRTRQDPDDDSRTSLGMVGRIREAAPAIVELDIAALETLKDVLRGLVWAEEVLSDAEIIDYERFMRELLGVIEATTYRPQFKQDRQAILVADVIQARGIPFRAVALVGLAEGEFPASLQEDPFLRDSDRAKLSARFGFPLQPSLDSNEIGFFYESTTRARSNLLLTRPRLADNSAPWQASPYWEEVRRRVEVAPTQESTPAPPFAASWSELLESLSSHPEYTSLATWARQVRPSESAALEEAVHILTSRQRQQSGCPFDGGLQDLQLMLTQRFGPEHTWSASRLEAYQTCPFIFFVAHALGLEPRTEPTEGLDASQLGNIYHHIFEALYKSVLPANLSESADVLAMLDTVAAPILDAAPTREGFRATAWWAYTRQEIVDNVRRSLEVLAELPGDFVPWGHEVRFREPNALVLQRDNDRLLIHGFIDRIDVNPHGELRVIDYKTSHPSGFSERTFGEGKKLQVAIYALAARDALNLGTPVDGFYFHVRHAEPSAFSLAGFHRGVDAALEMAVEHTWSAVQSIREGRFEPHPPGDGCPPYCPAAAFCWQFRPSFGG